MATSRTIKAPESFEFEVPDHKTVDSADNAIIAPVHLTAPVPVTDTILSNAIDDSLSHHRVTASIRSAFVVAGVIALAGGTGTLVVAALAVR
jgi:hypothetical protein